VGETATAARESVEALLASFDEFRRFVYSPQSVRKSDVYEVFETKWDEVKEHMPQRAALLTGNRGHREVVIACIEAAEYAQWMYRDGFGVSDNPRSEYLNSSAFAFETIAAWLRLEKVPSDAKRYARRSRKQKKMYDLEMRWRRHYEDTGQDLPTGVARVAARKAARHTKEFFARELKPLRDLWDYLFRE
jgi:hypothetical protein